MAPGAVAPKDPAVKVAAVKVPGTANVPAVTAPEIVAEGTEPSPVATILAADIPPEVVTRPLTTFTAEHEIGPVVIGPVKLAEEPVSAPPAVIVPVVLMEAGVISPSDTVGVTPLLTATPFAPSITTTPSAPLTDKTPDTGGGTLAAVEV